MALQLSVDSGMGTASTPDDATYHVVSQFRWVQNGALSVEVMGYADATSVSAGKAPKMKRSYIWQLGAAAGMTLDFTQNLITQIQTKLLTLPEWQGAQAVS